MQSYEELILNQSPSRRESTQLLSCTPPLSPSIPEDEANLLFQNAQEAADLAEKDGILEESYFQATLAEQNAHQMAETLSAWKNKFKDPKLEAYQQRDMSMEDNTTIVSFDNLDNSSLSESILTTTENDDTKFDLSSSVERTVVFNLETEMHFAGQVLTEKEDEIMNNNQALSSSASTDLYEYTSSNNGTTSLNEQEGYIINNQTISMLSDTERNEYSEAVRSAEKVAKDMKETLAWTIEPNSSKGVFSFSSSTPSLSEKNTHKNSLLDKLRNEDLTPPCSNQSLSSSYKINKECQAEMCSSSKSACFINNEVFRSAEKAVKDLEETIASSCASVVTSTSASIISSDLTIDNWSHHPLQMESSDLDGFGTILIRRGMIPEDDELQVQQEQYHLYCSSLDGFLPENKDRKERKRIRKQTTTQKKRKAFVRRTRGSRRVGQAFETCNGIKNIHDNNNTAGPRKKLEIHIKLSSKSIPLPTHGKCSIWNIKNRKLWKMLVRHTTWVFLLSLFIAAVTYKTTGALMYSSHHVLNGNEITHRDRTLVNNDPLSHANCNEHAYRTSTLFSVNQQRNHYQEDHVFEGNCASKIST